MCDVVTYELLNRDVVVLAFRYSTAIHQPIELLDLVEPSYAPPVLFDEDDQIALANLAYWWSTRSIPASREHFAQVMEALRVGAPAELAERCMGLTLSDRYWVRERGDALAWADVNFFDNAFSEDLGFVTLEGHSPQRDIELRSPSSSVIGDLRKKWVVRNGVRWLVKGPSSLFAQEPYNEVVATALHRRVLSPQEFVPYDLETTASGTYCRCPNMLSANEELVSAWDLLYRHRRERNAYSFGRLLRIFEGLGLENVQAGLSRIFVTDALLANPDRHLRNLGVIRDAATLQWLRIAPVFDSGAGLWCRQMALTHEQDFAYEPKPFLNHAGRPYDVTGQLNLFDACDWLDLGELDPWREEALGILALNPLLTPERLERIDHGLRAQIGLVEHHESCMR